MKRPEVAIGTVRSSLLAVLFAVMVSCGADPAADLPSPGEIESNLNRVLADTGSFADAAVVRVIGKHYVPGDDRWQIVACFRFTDAAGDQIQECLDSFSLLRLDNGRWIAAVNRDGVYRWREFVRPSLELVNTAEQTQRNN